jgi:hypothetical protein
MPESVLRQFKPSFSLWTRERESLPTADWYLRVYRLSAGFDGSIEIFRFFSENFSGGLPHYL